MKTVNIYIPVEPMYYLICTNFRATGLKCNSAGINLRAARIKYNFMCNNIRARQFDMKCFFYIFFQTNKIEGEGNFSGKGI